MFFEFIRLLDGLKPRVFVAENVSGLVKGVAKGVFLEILAKLKACGYRVGVKVLDAQWLGVPQARQRTIFIGVREDLGKPPVFPKPLPYRYTLRDALPWIVRGKYGQTWKPADAPSPTVSAHGSYNSATSHQGLELVEAVIHDTKGKFPSAVDITDRPSPAITVVGRNQFKVQIRGGTGAAFSRLALQQKLAVGAEPASILQKELSLAGYQRPLDTRLLPKTARVLFQVGEFVGWIIEAPEA